MTRGKAEDAGGGAAQGMGFQKNTMPLQWQSWGVSYKTRYKRAASFPARASSGMQKAG